MMKLFIVAILSLVPTASFGEITSIIQFPGGQEGQVQYGANSSFEGIQNSLVQGSTVTFGLLIATTSLKVGTGTQISTFTPAGLELKYGVSAATGNFTGKLNVSTASSSTTHLFTVGNNLFVVTVSSLVGINRTPSAVLDAQQLTVDGSLVFLRNSTGQLIHNFKGDTDGDGVYEMRSGVDAIGVHLDSNGDNYILNKFGVGTASPTYQLQVSSNIGIPLSTGTVGVIFAGTFPFIHANTSINAVQGYNFYAGVDAGNLNASLNSTGGSGNVGIGYRALKKGTSGGASVNIYNTEVGSEALYNNTSGWSNTAIGWQAMTSNTTGDQNVAIGNGSLGANVSGSSNTAVGDASLYT